MSETNMDAVVLARKFEGQAMLYEFHAQDEPSKVMRELYMRYANKCRKLANEMWKQAAEEQTRFAATDRKEME